MKNAIRLAIASTTLLGAALAHAQASLPSSGTSDLFLFVENTSTKVTFIEDTGISISSLMPSTLTAGQLQSEPSVTINTSGSSATSALASFIASAGSNLIWGVEGTQQATSGKAYKPGVIEGLTDSVSGAGVIGGLVQTNLQSWENGFNQDAGIMNSDGLAANGYITATADNAVTGSVWNGTSGNVGGSGDLYGTGASDVVSGTGASNVTTLYGVTGGASASATTYSYILGQLELTASGVLETVGSSSTVPLPAAVWLFGSGLLGLAGVGRRRSSAV